MTSLVNNNLDDKILVYENEDLAAKLEKAINEYFAKSTRVLGGKVHVSSLTYCLRAEAIKSYLISSGQIKPTDLIDIHTAFNFVRGLTSEYFLTKLMEDEIEPQKDLSLENRVQGHPDAVTKDNGAIIEMKNSNTYTGMTVNDDSLYTYMRQTVIYMVMSAIEVGHVIVVYNLPMSLEYMYSSQGKSVYTSKSRKNSGERPFKVFTLNLNKHSQLRDKIKESLRVAHRYINGQNYKEKETVKNFPRIDSYPNDIKCKYCSVKKQCDKLGVNEDLNMDLIDVLLNKVIDSNITPIIAKS